MKLLEKRGISVAPPKQINLVSTSSAEVPSTPDAEMTNPPSPSLPANTVSAAGKSGSNLPAPVTISPQSPVTPDDLSSDQGIIYIYIFIFY